MRIDTPNPVRGSRWVNMARALRSRNYTVLQTLVDDDKRGRVMSFYSLSFMGIVPTGCKPAANCRPSARRKTADSADRCP
jgi:hypothetical protein